MTLRSEFHTATHAVILVLHKWDVRKQGGRGCDGSTASFCGRYCKCVMRDFNVLLYFL